MPPFPLGTEITSERSSAPPAHLSPLTETAQPLGNSGTRRRTERVRRPGQLPGPRARATQTEHQTLRTLSRERKAGRSLAPSSHLLLSRRQGIRHAGRGSRNSPSDPGITQQTAGSPHLPGPINQERKVKWAPHRPLHTRLGGQEPQPEEGLSRLPPGLHLPATLKAS